MDIFQTGIGHGNKFLTFVGQTNPRKDNDVKEWRWGCKFWAQVIWSFIFQWQFYGTLLIIYSEHLSIVFTGVYALVIVAISLAGALSSFATSYGADIDYFGSTDFRMYRIMDIVAFSVNSSYLLYMIVGSFLSNMWKSNKMGENPKVCILNHHLTITIKWDKMNFQSHANLTVRFGVLVFGTGTVISWSLILYDESASESLVIWCHIMALIHTILMTFFIFMFPRVNLRVHPFFDRYNTGIQ